MCEIIVNNKLESIDCWKDSIKRKAISPELPKELSVPKAGQLLARLIFYIRFGLRLPHFIYKLSNL